MTMKRLTAAFLCLLLLTGCGAKGEAPDADAPTLEEQAALPQPPAAEDVPAEEDYPVDEGQFLNLGSFEAQTLDGETLTEDFFANADLTLINVWATFCGPCKQEMPALGKLDRELENVQILGIVTDVIDQNGKPDPMQIETAVALVEATEATYPSLILNESLAMLGFASLSGVPATLFVDSEGNLVGDGFYGAHSEDSWREIIAERLEMLG